MEMVFVKDIQLNSNLSFNDWKTFNFQGQCKILKL